MVDGVDEAVVTVAILIGVMALIEVVLLAGPADPANPASGHGEDLQDHAACPPPAEVAGK